MYRLFFQDVIAATAKRMSTSLTKIKHGKYRDYCKADIKTWIAFLKQYFGWSYQPSSGLKLIRSLFQRSNVDSYIFYLTEFVFHFLICRHQRTTRFSDFDSIFLKERRWTYWANYLNGVQLVFNKTVQLVFNKTISLCPTLLSKHDFSRTI